MRERSNLADQAAEVRAAGPVPDRALITFTVLEVDPSCRLVLSEDAEDEHTQAKQAVFDALSASVTGEHRLLAHASPSWIHIEAEDAIAGAVREVIGRARKLCSGA
ncbi:hypothetical protein [Micromonospora chersina]